MSVQISQWQEQIALANKSLSVGDFINAEHCLQKALNSANSTSAPAEALANIYGTYGVCYEQQNKLVEATQAYSYVLSVCQSYGKSYPKQELYALKALGRTNYKIGDSAEAKKAFNQALTLMQTELGKDNAETLEFAMEIEKIFPSDNESASASSKPSKSDASQANILKPSKTKMADRSIDINELVHHREKIYTAISTVVAVIVYGISILCVIGIPIGILGFLAGFVFHGTALGHIRGSGIKISKEQFPEIYNMLEQYSQALNMPLPATYILNGHGMLNAFATKLHRHDIVVIYSEVLELAYSFGEAELAFVLCHELGHVKLGHVKRHWIDLPAHCIPFFGNALSRAREYSCDRIAQAAVPDGALFGLVALSTGTKLFKKVNLEALYKQQDEEWNFWTWFSEVISSHPNLVNRISALGIRHASAEQTNANSSKLLFGRR